MYDTVNFWIERAMVGGDPFTIAQYLDEAAEHSSNRGYTVTGKAGDYSVLLTDSGISLKGSLPKLLLPSNIHTLNRSGAKDAIIKLSDTLHLPIMGAKVTRVDVSAALPVPRPVNDYYQYLGNKPHSQRLQATVDTLYYNKKMMQHIFYNKIAEAKAKSMMIPAGFDGANLLRVEVRFIQRLPKQFNRTEITGATLYEEKFYTDIVQRWGKEYYSIDKLKSTSIMNTTNIKTPKDGVNALFSFLLQDREPGFINAFIADLRAKKTFDDPKYYSRLKDDLNKLTKATTIAEQSELIRELDQSIREVILNCR
jgi:hypothetical protein